MERPRRKESAYGSIPSVAKLLAEHITDRHPAEAFLVGIFHDVGKLVFFELLPDEYTEIVCREKHEKRLETESSLFGITHESIGSQCGHQWGLPEYINQAIGNHHRSSEAANSTGIAALANLANDLARMWQVGYEGEDVPTEPNDYSIRELSLTSDQLTDVQERVHEAFEEVKSFCGG